MQIAKELPSAKWLGHCLLKSLALVFFSTSAQTTYIAAIFNDDVLAIAADSRGTDLNGSIDDGICKIQLLNDQLAFVLMGYQSWSPDEKTIPRIQLFELAKSTSTDGRIADIAVTFGKDAVSRLNGLPPELRTKALEPPPFSSTGIFGGVGVGGAAVASVSISYTERLNLFEASTSHSYNAGKLISFGPSTAAEIIGSAEFIELKNKKNIAIGSLYGSVMHYLVKQMIARGVDDLIGGVPSVLIIERGRRPYWYSKAQSCPDVK